LDPQRGQAGNAIKPPKPWGCASVLFLCGKRPDQAPATLAPERETLRNWR
jgi:hypothetical protein